MAVGMSALLRVMSTFGLRSNDVSISRSRLFQKLVFSRNLQGHQFKNFWNERVERGRLGGRGRVAGGCLKSHLIKYLLIIFSCTLTFPVQTCVLKEMFVTYSQKFFFSNYQFKLFIFIIFVLGASARQVNQTLAPSRYFH